MIRMDMCAHGKSLRDPCMACSKLDRAEERLHSELADLRHEAGRLRTLVEAARRAETLEEVREILGEAPTGQEASATEPRSSASPSR